MRAIVSNRTIINTATVAEGAVFIIYASYSRILIGTRYFHLSTGQYGLVFLPELVTIIAAATLGIRMTRRFPTKQVYLVGLSCSLVSMFLLFASAAPAIHVADFPVLLASSAFVGAGFGMAIPALITYAVILSGRSETPVLAINALLVLGVAIPPISALVFTTSPYWWGPALLTAVLALLLIAGRRLPATRTADAAMQPFNRRVPAQLKVYELLVIVYGLCAVMCVAWSQPIALRPGHPHLTFIALVLGAFWAALVMLARLVFAMLDRRSAAAWTTSGLFALAAAAVVSTLVIHDYTMARLSIWVLAALACAALLPLRTQSKDQLTTLSVALAGAMALLYPLGIGLARASLTTLRQDGLSLPMVFGIVAVIGVGASVLLLRVPSPSD